MEYRKKLEKNKRLVLTKVLTEEDVKNIGWIGELGDMSAFLHKAISGEMKHHLNKKQLKYNLSLIEDRLYEIEFSMGEDL